MSWVRNVILTWMTWALFSCKSQNSKTITSERESYMHGVLNLNEIKKRIAQFSCKLRDEFNKPNQAMIKHKIATVTDTIYMC